MERGEAIVSLAYLASYREHLVAADELNALGYRGSFFVRPDRAVQHVERWREVAISGHELGTGSLLELSLDGHLPAWPLPAVEEDLSMCDRFIEDILHSPAPVSVYAPGSRLVCADGPYAPLMEDRYTCVCGRGLGVNTVGSSPQQLVSSLVLGQGLCWTIIPFSSLSHIEESMRHADVLRRVADQNATVLPVREAAVHLGLA